MIGLSRAGATLSCASKGVTRIPEIPVRALRSLGSMVMGVPRVFIPSVDFRLGNAFGAFEEIEVATLVRLPGVLGKQPVIAARIISRWRLIGLYALGDLRIAELDVDRALGDVDADAIPG